MKSLQIVKKAVGQDPKLMTIPHSISSLQKHVGYGDIEFITMGDDIVLVFNKEGKLNGGMPNFVVDHYLVTGDALFVGQGIVDGEMDFKDLDDWQIMIILNKVGTKFDGPKIETDMTFAFLS